MLFLCSCSRTGTDFPADISNVVSLKSWNLLAQLFQHDVDSRFYVSPRSHVLVLFLEPDEFSITVFTYNCFEVFIRERSNLFYSDNCCAIVIDLLPLFNEFIICLA